MEDLDQFDFSREVTPVEEGIVIKQLNKQVNFGFISVVMRRYLLGFSFL